eukprot:g839.t1
MRPIIGYILPEPLLVSVGLNTAIVETALSGFLLAFFLCICAMVLWRFWIMNCTSFVWGSDLYMLRWRRQYPRINYIRTSFTLGDMKKEDIRDKIVEHVTGEKIFCVKFVDFDYTPVLSDVDTDYEFNLFISDNKIHFFGDHTTMDGFYCIQLTAKLLDFPKQQAALPYTYIPVWTEACVLYSGAQTLYKTLGYDKMESYHSSIKKMYMYQQMHKSVLAPIKMQRKKHKVRFVASLMAFYYRHVFHALKVKRKSLRVFITMAFILPQKRFKNNYSGVLVDVYDEPFAKSVRRINDQLSNAKIEALANYEIINVYSPALQNKLKKHAFDSIFSCSFFKDPKPNSIVDVDFWSNSISYPLYVLALSQGDHVYIGTKVNTPLIDKEKFASPIALKLLD